MSITGSKSTQPRASQSEVTVRPSTKNRVGFVIAILLSIISLAGLFSPTPEGEIGPPMLVLGLGAALGLVTIVAVGLAWGRGSGAAIRIALTAIIGEAASRMSGHESPSVECRASVRGVASARQGAEETALASDESAAHPSVGCDPGTHRQVGWIATVAAVAWFTTLVIGYRRHEDPVNPPTPTAGRSPRNADLHKQIADPAHVPTSCGMLT